MQKSEPCKVPAKRRFISVLMVIGDSRSRSFVFARHCTDTEIILHGRDTLNYYTKQTIGNGFGFPQINQSTEMQFCGVAALKSAGYHRLTESHWPVGMSPGSSSYIQPRQKYSRHIYIDSIYILGPARLHKTDLSHFIMTVWYLITNHLMTQSRNRIALRLRGAEF